MTDTEITSVIRDIEQNPVAPVAVGSRPNDSSAETPNAPPAAVGAAALTVTDEMVTRFLEWKFPKDFDPDGGIIFKKMLFFKTVGNKPRPDTWWPVGTNLLTATQAKEMLEYVLNTKEVMPDDSRRQRNTPDLARGAAQDNAQLEQLSRNETKGEEL